MVEYCRVLSPGDVPIPGLCAVGEVAGLGGINGKAGLEGTFSGPSLLQGRRAGRHVAATLRAQPAQPAQSQPQLAAAAAAVPVKETASDLLCRLCHGLPLRFLPDRPGFRHFGRAHRMARDRAYPCGRCHGEMGRLPWTDRTDPLAATHHCAHCHLPRK